MAENPWLLHHITEGKAILSKAKRPRVGDSEDPLLAEGDESEGDVAKDEAFCSFKDVFLAVKSAKEEAAGLPGVPDGFQVKPLGGEWTAVNKGVPVDGFNATYSDSHVHDFMRKYGLPAEKKFMSSLYGREGSMLMAKAVTRRLGFYYDLWAASGFDAKFKFKRSAINSYAEDEDFKSFADTITDKRALNGLRTLRAMQPPASA